MARTGTVEGIPMFFTELWPRKIIGKNNMDIFITYFNICKSATNNGEFPHARLNKEIGVKNREMIVRIMNTLRDNGFYPLSVTEEGNIKWGVMTKSQSQIIFEKDLPRYQKMSMKELQTEGRRGYLQVVENSEVKPAKDYELDFAGKF